VNRTGRRLLTAVAAALLRLVPWTAAAPSVLRIGLNDEPLAVHVVGVAPQPLEETQVLRAADEVVDLGLLARGRFALGGAEWLRSRRRS
jgi:hypothetical protein